MDTIDPIVVCINELSMLGTFVSICQRGIKTATHESSSIDLIGRISEVIEEPNPYDKNIDRALENAKKFEAFASPEVHEGFPYLHGLASVRLWSALETVVEDLSAMRIEKRSENEDIPLLSEIKGPVLQFNAMSNSQRTEFLVRELARKVNADLRVGVGKFEALLKALGIGGPVDPEIRRVLLELSQSRNVIVHRGGKVDSHFLEACPWRTELVGDSLIITRDIFSRYIQAAYWYLLELKRRWMQLHGETIKRIPELQMELLEKWRVEASNIGDSST